MKKTAKQYAAAAGLSGALALTAAICSFAQVQTPADMGNQVSQYCAPEEENSDTLKVYCRNEHG